jgi:hypothetical protein
MIVVTSSRLRREYTFRVSHMWARPGAGEATIPSLPQNPARSCCVPAPTEQVVPGFGRPNVSRAKLRRASRARNRTARRPPPSTRGDAKPAPAAGVTPCRFRSRRQLGCRAEHEPADSFSSKLGGRPHGQQLTTVGTRVSLAKQRPIGTIGLFWLERPFVTAFHVRMTRRFLNALRPCSLSSSPFFFERADRIVGKRNEYRDERQKSVEPCGAAPTIGEGVTKIELIEFAH